MAELWVGPLGELRVNYTWVVLEFIIKKMTAINEVPQISEKGGMIFKSMGNLTNFSRESFFL